MNRKIPRGWAREIRQDSETPEAVEITEARIIIGSIELTLAQSMTVRVAVGSMLLQLEDQEYRAALGPIAEGYGARLREVESLIMLSIGGRGI